MLYCLRKSIEKYEKNCHVILNKAFSSREWALCQLCVLSFRVEVKGEEDTSNAIQRQSNCEGVKSI